MKCERCGKQVAGNPLYCEYCGERRFKAKIRLVDNAGNDNTIYLFSKDYVIGRDKSCEIFLDDSSVSRNHACLMYEGNSFHIEDLKSKNGLLVNGEPATEVKLSNFDCVQIGSTSIHFYYPDGEFPEDKIFSNTTEFVQATLLKITREIQSKNMLDEVLNTVLDGIMAVSHAKDATLWLPNENNEWEIRLSRNFKSIGEGDRMVLQLKKLAQRIERDSTSYIMHPNGEQAFFKNIHKAENNIYRMLALPLLSRNQFNLRKTQRSVLGVVILRTSPAGRRLDLRNISLLESLAIQGVMALENSMLYSEALAKRKIDNELELAKEIQGQLLPRQLPEVPNTDMAAYSRARNYVGGDYYDVLKVRDEGIGIVISDVIGKGIGAALLMSSLQGSLRAQISYESRPENIVNNINTLFRESATEKIFATFFFCLYDHNSGDLTYQNAGHNHPIVLRKSGGEDLLKSSSPPLGVVEKCPGTERTIRLAPGEIVVFYTDGLVEAMNEKMKPLGFEPVRQYVRDFITSHKDASAQDILDAILKRVEKHVEKQPQHDDLTILILKRNG
ncbi:MAG: SpoIIE family protein phosphatase [Deferribacteres bacterium]|nr:SpoIIE family protein phosphatase [candidate division KSB1 bacterium]MCB9509666.1 SpoIIE family protein phosphatase [Deferribacteres bacterium]